MRHNTYYQLIRDVLEYNIKAGKLPAGTRLLTAAVADILGVSRPPVKRAMDLLVKDGFLVPLAGQGYRVGEDDADGSSVRENLHLLDLDLSIMENPNKTPLAARWEEVYEELKNRLLLVIPFGTYQISETSVAEAFSVSRTVAHEALARLDAAGLIRKSRSSHWTTGPLSVQMLDEAFEMRYLLEPASLAKIAHEIPRVELIAMKNALRNAAYDGPALSIPRLTELEQALHINCLKSLKNRQLFDTLMRLQLDHVVNEVFRRHVTIPDDREMLSEHIMVVDHLLLGDGHGAAAALRYHLEVDHQRTRDRLKVLALFDEPTTAPWLTQIV